MSVLAIQLGAHSYSVAELAVVLASGSTAAFITIWWLKRQQAKGQELDTAYLKRLQVKTVLGAIGLMMAFLVLMVLMIAGPSGEP